MNEYELSLCVKLLSYAALTSIHTAELRASEILRAAAVFFGDEVVQQAKEILVGNAEPIKLDRYFLGNVD